MTANSEMMRLPPSKVVEIFAAAAIWSESEAPKTPETLTFFRSLILLSSFCLVEEETAKVLDDLFKKTTATPSVYWLPLTDDQVTISFHLNQPAVAIVLQASLNVKRVSVNSEPIG